jgi:hypothetical protein
MQTTTETENDVHEKWSDNGKKLLWRGNWFFRMHYESIKKKFKEFDELYNNAKIDQE